MARGRRESSFFKALQGDHYSQKLRIPGAFLKYFYGKLPKQFHLQTPVGTWRVDVERVDNKFYIQNGWEKFVRENGSSVNEFVVFHYNGNSEFSVSIYGTNMCKKSSVMASGCSRSTSAGIPTCIHCPMEEANEEESGEEDEAMEEANKEESGEEDEAEDDVDYGDNDENESEEATENEDEDHNEDSDDSSVEIVSELKTRCKPPLGSQLHKSKLLGSNAKAQRNMNDVHGQGESYLKRRQDFHRSEHQAMTTKDETLQRADDFAHKSVYPCCVILIRRSYATGAYLNIPAHFVERYLKEKPIHAIFRTNGRKYPVKLDYSFVSARVVGGWYKFSHCFKLEENDVCVLMLTNTIEFSFDVEIFRITEATQSLPGGYQLKSKYGSSSI